VIAQERMELDAKRESLEESKKRVQSFKDFWKEVRILLRLVY
jgi:hypothetical protein